MIRREDGGCGREGRKEDERVEELRYMIQGLKTGRRVRKNVRSKGYGVQRSKDSRHFKDLVV